MTTDSDTPAGWYADPRGTPDLLRWWDGSRWTGHTRAGSVPEPAPGGGTLFTEPVLAVVRPPSPAPAGERYTVHDRHGARIGSVAEAGQDPGRKPVRFLSSYEPFTTHRLDVRDAHGRPLLRLSRPGRLIHSRWTVRRPDGTEVGEIVHRHGVGRVHLGLTAGGERIGAVRAEDRRTGGLAVVDRTGSEVGRITKGWGEPAPAAFTGGEPCVLRTHRRLADPLLTLVVAAALTVDTAPSREGR